MSRFLRRLGETVAAALGAFLLLFLLLETPVLGDPALREAGAHAGPVEVAATRARLGALEDFQRRALTLRLAGAPASRGQRLELRVRDGALHLAAEGAAGGRTVALGGRPLAEVADEVADAALALDPPRLLEARVAAGLEAAPADGLAAALEGGVLLLPVGMERSLAWGRPVSAPRRFLHRLGEVLRGDLGTDRDGRPVARELLRRGAVSLAYALPAFVLATLLALGLGLAAGWRGGRLDATLAALSLALLSVSAVSALLVWRRVLTVELGLLPLRPWGPPRLPLLLLPIALWVLVAPWGDLRLYRALVRDRRDAPHLRAGRARGLTESRLALAHLLPGLLPTVFAHLAHLVPFLVFGSLLLERLCDLPGLGEYLVDGLARADVRVLEGGTLLAAALFLLAQLAADLGAALVDPRLRSAAR